MIRVFSMMIHRVVLFLLMQWLCSFRCLWGSVCDLSFDMHFSVLSSFENNLKRKRGRVGCFALIFFLMYCDCECSVALFTMP